MKKSQECVLIVGLVLFLIISLFPPFTGIYVRENIKQKIDMGYHFLFNRLDPVEVYTKIYDDSFYYPKDDDKLKDHIIAREADNCYIHLNYRFYIFHYFILMNIVMGLFFIFKHRKSEN